MTRFVSGLLLGLLIARVYDRWRAWEQAFVRREEPHGVDLEPVGRWRARLGWTPPPENITISPPENWTIQPPDSRTTSLSDAIRPMLERRDAG